MKPYGSLNNYISKHRKVCGLSKEELGELLDVDRKQVTAFEEQEAVPTLAQAIGLALIFQEPMQELFAGLGQRMRVWIAARARSLLERQSDQVTRENAETLRTLANLSHIDEEEFTWRDTA